MREKILFCLSFLILTLPVLSQERQGRSKETITVSGKVVDTESDTPLEFATLVLQNVDDPNDLNGGVTDIDGNFSVETIPGKYNIRVEYISYKPYELKNQNLTSDLNMGTVKLALDVAQLEAVEIIGERTTVEVRLDKKVYNIGKDLTTSGATISDALNNVPSVSVDVEGGISLRGNENVRILINGRPSALAGFGSTEALQSLPADAIEKVEVITSPSARYDAEGTAGILNIVLKKEKTLGLNGTVQTNIGYPDRGQITTNFNLRTDKFNIFNTLGYSYNAPPGNGFFDNRFLSGTFDRVIEDRDIMRTNKSFNANIGMEYFLTDRQSITTSFFTRLGDEKDATENDTQRFIDSDLAARTFRSEVQNEDDLNYQISLNYRNQFNEDGHELTVDMQYSYDDEEILANIEERNTFPDTQLQALEIVNEFQTQKNYLIQADYVLPVGDSQFEAGYRGTFDTDRTDYALDTLNQNTGEFVSNLGLTNIFTLKQNVHALYTQYGNKFGKFSFLAGLRLETTELIGDVESELSDDAIEEELGLNFDTNFDKDFVGLFPTINLIYELNEEENISLGYNRRINRPRGWFLNPFPSRSSRTNIFQGNPDLDPAFADAFDIGYLKRWKSLTLTSSVYYQRETNSFERVQEDTGQTTPDGIAIIRSIPINLSTNERVGAELGLLYSYKRWLRLNGSFNFFRFDTEGFYNGVDFSAENTSWFARFSSKVTLPGSVDWQTNAFYRGPTNNAQTENKGIFSLDLALAKDIMDGNGTLTFNVSDLLNSRKRMSFTQTPFFVSDSEFQWRERQFTLSFIYRFNQSKQDNRRNERNGNREYDNDGGEFEG